MKTHIMVTAGAVGGFIDDNKLITNRARGLWATHFAERFARENAEALVSLVLPANSLLAKAPINRPNNLEYLLHDGYASYRELCERLAPTLTGAVMAAAVVNWLPEPLVGRKMKTEGYAEGDTVDIKFRLMPRVIDRMRALNPYLRLVGCKLTVGAQPSELRVAARETLRRARCHAVVANDLQSLRMKYILYGDGSFHPMTSFDELETTLGRLLTDDFFVTAESPRRMPNAQGDEPLYRASVEFNALAARYRTEMVPASDDSSHVHGAIAVRVDATRMLVSPRRKLRNFTSVDAVVVDGLDLSRRVLFTVGGLKASMNAPLLYRVMGATGAGNIVHLHNNKVSVPDDEWREYTIPGTFRDTVHPLKLPLYIKEHGCFFEDQGD